MALLHEDLTGRIIGVFYDVDAELGQGFLESVCQTAMGIALTESGLSLALQAPLEVWFRGRAIGSFIPDIVVNDLVCVEIKSGRCIHPAHEAQLLNYCEPRRWRLDCSSTSDPSRNTDAGSSPTTAKYLDAPKHPPTKEFRVVCVIRGSSWQQGVGKPHSSRRAAVGPYSSCRAPSKGGRVVGLLA